MHRSVKQYKLKVNNFFFIAAPSFFSDINVFNLCLTLLYILMRPAARGGWLLTENSRLAYNKDIGESRLRGHGLRRHKMEEWL